LRALYEDGGSKETWKNMLEKPDIAVGQRCSECSCGTRAAGIANRGEVWLVSLGGTIMELKGSMLANRGWNSMYEIS
jgi:hypothetical protein